VVKNHEDFPIRLTANLDVATRYLRQRKPTPPPIWIDALCINQSLASERNHQVGLMSKAYSSADRVLIWLGPPCQDSEFAFHALSSGELGEQHIARFINSLDLLLRRDWFTKLWVAQELVLARRDPIIYHGWQTFDWKDFSLAVQHVQAKTKEIGNVGRSNHAEYLQHLTREAIEEAESDTYPPAVVARAESIQHLVDIRKSGVKASFAQRILHTMYLQPTDPRDRVYGLLGFFSFDHSPIIPNYAKSMPLVYAKAAAFIAQEDLCLYIGFQRKFVSVQSYGEGEKRLLWFPNLPLLAAAQRSAPPRLPCDSDLERALLRAYGVAPIAAFSSDNLTLFTAGRNLGQTKAHDHCYSGGDLAPWAGSTIDYLPKSDPGSGCYRIISALEGFSHRRANFGEVLRSLVSPRLTVNPEVVDHVQVKKKRLTLAV
jgi:hypothetical protein